MFNALIIERSLNVLPRIYKKIIVYFFIFLLTSSISQFAHAAINRGIFFQDEITVGGRLLTLQGIGLLKWKYLIKVYSVGFYMPSHISSAKALEDIPKLLEYYFFINMKAKDFQTTGFELMALNVGEEKALSLRDQLFKLNSFYQDVKAGQRYTLTYTPSRGLELALDGKVLGILNDADFASAYFSIWLGPNPVSKELQKGLFDSSTKTHQ